MVNKLKNKLDFWVVSSIIIAVVLGIFLAYPLFSLLIRAFRDSGTGAVTMANFVKFFSKKYYFKGLLKSLGIGTTVTVLATLIGGPLAYIMAS